MTDYVLQPALDVARIGFRYLDSTGLSRGVYTGTPQTTNYGGDRIGASIEFAPAGGASSTAKAKRRRMLATLMQLRGKTNRIFVQDASYVQGGSFPSSELLTNSDFSNGTTGWSTGSKYSLSASNGVMRNTIVDGAAGAGLALYQTVSLTQYAPYVVRGVVLAGRGAWATGMIYRYLNTGYSSFANMSGYGLDSDVVLLASANAGFYDASTTGLVAGDFFETSFISASRCALVDGGGNLLLRSDEINNVAWTKTRATTTTDTSQAADGTSTMDGLIEDSSNNTHFAFQGVTVTAPAQDIMFSVIVAAAGRNFVELQMQEATTTVSQYFILTGGGSVGVNGASGANWSNRRAFVTNLGNGRIRCTLIARKTSAATSVTGIISLASADGTDSYLGNGSSGVVTWRAVLTPSGVPTRGTQTTSAAIASVPQPGLALYVKGLPASTAGLLLAGDLVEIDGQIKFLTAPLDSDAAGLGYLQFSPPLRRSVADNTPIIVCKPMGRFILSGGESGWMSEPGIQSMAALELEEAFS